MEILKVRPARVSAALVAVGDMLVTSPVGKDGPRESTWLGAVVEHVIVQDEEDPAAWRVWMIQPVGSIQNAVTGELEPAVRTMTHKIPANGWVWVHLPHAA